jgi:hypothetical protein
VLADTLFTNRTIIVDSVIEMSGQQSLREPLKMLADVMFLVDVSFSNPEEVCVCVCVCVCVYVTVNTFSSMLLIYGLQHYYLCVCTCLYILPSTHVLPQEQVIKDKVRAFCIQLFATFISSKVGITLSEGDSDISSNPSLGNSAPGVGDIVGKVAFECASALVFVSMAHYEAFVCMRV